jgi:hypothetical protein
MVCAYLSVALLIRLLLNALAGWWWADPVAAPAIAALAAKEIEKLEAWLFAIARVASNTASALFRCDALARLRVQVDAAWSSRASRFAPERASRSRGGPPCQSRHSAVASSRS